MTGVAIEAGRPIPPERGAVMAVVMITAPLFFLAICLLSHYGVIVVPIRPTSSMTVASATTLASGRLT